MFPFGRRLLAAGLILVLCAPAARAQTTINGNALAMRSSGSSNLSSWVLNDNGYVGTYVTLPTAGNVTITVNASGTSFGGVAPRMNISVADSLIGFDVAAGSAAYPNTFALPAGTHFIRAELANDPLKTSRALTVSSLQLDGASVANSNSNANALAAADSYIQNYRRGLAKVALTGVAPGTPVTVSLRRHDFRFGTAVGGTTLNGVNSFLNNANFSNFLRNNFNTITQGNAGKWTYNEANRDVVTMAAVDRFFSYAEQHGLDVRVHNMLWGNSQQPNWATALMTTALGTDPVAAAAAKAELRAEISERIDHYVGDSDGNPNDGDRARRYVEMDLLNEHDHQAHYWNAYGAAGIADIFTEAGVAVSAAGSQARLYLNEYNVFQWGDSYGNWYREDVDAIKAAGGAIGGIGIQYYPSATSNSAAIHSPVRMQQVLQGLSVAGLPLSLTEFGVSAANGTTFEQAGTYMTDTMRMVFGTPQATTFMMWGFATNDVWDQAPMAALMDATTGQPTAVGLQYQALMNQWKTNVTVPVAADGTVDFTGFYGDYDVTIGNDIYSLSLEKGEQNYQLVVDLAADFDNDRTVTANDLTVWREQQAVGGNGADADGDLDTDGDDLLIWQRQLGMSESVPLPMAPIRAVPEPGAATILLAGMLSLLNLARTRRSRRR